MVTAGTIMANRVFWHVSPGLAVGSDKELPQVPRVFIAPKAEPFCSRKE